MQLLQATDRQTTSFPFRLAPIRMGASEPVWNGLTFSYDNVETRVLHYGSTGNGWTDELTDFHEDAAGANHFIDVASRNHALSQLSRLVRASHPTVLEIGTSSGFMLDLLRKANPNGLTIGSDIVGAPLERLSTRLTGTPLLRFDLVECPLPNDCIDASVALNVLEHIEDDKRAVQQLFRVTKPGGIVVIEVPAGPELFNDFDRMLMHYRRYTLNGLTKMLTEAGFQINYASHLGCFLYPGFWLVKQLSKLKKTQDNQPDQQSIEGTIKFTATSKPLEAATKLELALGKAVRYPFGIRCLVTCSKPLH
jgi:SAM-dependent methyltransferase